MDKATLTGLFLGALAVVGGHFLEGGSLGMILQATALVIVLGGTCGAVCLSFSWVHIRQALRALPRIFREPPDDAEAHLTQLVELAYQARKEGLLALEKEMPNLPDAFWRRGLSLLLDGLPPEQVQEVMAVELAQGHEAALQPARVFEAAGGYAPTIGILGAVLGLIQVMQHLTEPAKLGTGVAVAFVATIYGVSSANLFFLPVAHKLRLWQEQRYRQQEMVLDGLLALARGEHPRLIGERLRGYLREAPRDAWQGLHSPKVRRLTPRSPRERSHHAPAKAPSP
jgi:chemotaxis protein MotA